MKFDNLFFEGVDAHTMRSKRRAPTVFRRAPMPVLPVEIDTFFESLFRRAALSSLAYRDGALARRLPACLRFLGVSTVEEAWRQIEAEPALARAALNVVLVGVSEFFRDRLVFDRLRQNILPAVLVRNARPRIWSAACADGQELYSVAMLLAEAGGLGKCELLGTDCRPEAIDQARLGVFASAAVAGLDAHWRENFFIAVGNSVLIEPALRSMTHWKVADLFCTVEAGPWQVILWRNMAIYLEPPAAERLWKRLCEQIAPLGYLIVGRADHPPANLPLMRIAKCIYQKIS